MEEKKQYQPQEIESKWQKFWLKEKVYQVDLKKAKNKFYCLTMFIYPSGDKLHIGHWYNYGPADSFARFKKMQGLDVFSPIGYDAFGLPAENYAIKKGVHPQVSTDENIKYIREQLKAIGAIYDWDYEINTSDPEYYRWTQWVFLELYKKGLAYRQQAKVNWCPSCQTVLANEQVKEGLCERCDSKVVQREMTQWFFKITKYAEELLNHQGLDWPAKSIAMQKNWIGRSEGALINFEIPALARVSAGRRNSKFKTRNFKSRIVLMHGKNTDPTKKWYPWLKKEAEEHKVEFIAPTLPDSQDPEIKVWLNELEKTRPDENTILVGHSRGGVTILRWLEKWGAGKKVKKVILVGTNSGHSEKMNKSENNRGFFTKDGFDFKKIKKHCDEFVVLHSRDDEWVPFEAGLENAEGLGAKLLSFDDRGHFGRKVTDIPELIDEIFSAIDFPLSQKYNYVLLHGFTGSATGDFFPWLKGELEKRGCRVVVPNLPNSDHPKEEEQVEYVLKECSFDQNTILLGHSLGGPVAMKVIERLPVNIVGLVLVAAFAEPKFKDHPRPYEKDFNWQFDFEKIRRKVDFVTVLADRNDYAVPIEQGRLVADKLRGNFIEVESCQPHFLTREEPVILKNLLPSIEVFTTRPDTIFGATYLVVAPEHPLVARCLSLVANRDEVESYLEKSQKKSEMERTELAKEKTGVELKGIKAINPANNHEIPIWVADYVVMNYGTGAIMAVPAHDERDFEFAKKYRLPIIKVINPPAVMNNWTPEASVASPGAYGHLGSDLESECWTGDGVMINSGKFNGLDSVKAKDEITKFVGGQKTINYKLHDWLISRQRYWGAPIPIIYCPKCGEVAVPEKDLPVKLPEEVDFKPTGESPLARSKKFVETKCPKCGGSARREVDTMDTFVCSSWYYFRYLSPHDDKKPFDQKLVAEWLPVDMYVGGAEHITMHLIYARFIVKVLMDDKNYEPFKSLRHQGTITKDGAKMSKSRGNVVIPDQFIKKYGSDCFRMFLMFMGPYEQGGDWNDQGILGIKRFLERVWNVFNNKASQGQLASDSKIEHLLNQTIKKVTEDLENFRFNTAISGLMILFNELSGRALTKSEKETFLKLLAPLAPHLVEELWQGLGYKKSIFKEKWPAYDSKMIRTEEVEIVIQVNGKLRDTVRVATDSGEAEVKEMALASQKVKAHLKGEPKKIIFVKNKLINFVV